MQESASAVTSLQTIEQDALTTEKKVANLTITDQETFNVGAESVALLRKMLSLAEEQHDIEKRPHLDAGKAVDEKYRPCTTKIKGLIASLDQKMGLYHQQVKALEEAQRKEAERLRLKAEEDARKAQIEYQKKLALAAAEAAKKNEPMKPPPPPPPLRPMPVAPPPPVAPKAVETAFGSVSMRGTWTYEITDEKKIPKEYLTVDEKKIAKVVKAGIREIPGVRIFEKFGSTTKG